MLFKISQVIFPLLKLLPMVSSFKQNKRVRIFPVILSPTPSLSCIPVQCVQRPPTLQQEKKEGKKLNPDPFQFENRDEAEPGS